MPMHLNSNILLINNIKLVYFFITNNLKQINTDESFWYLDGVRPDKSTHLILNTQKLFVYDYTRIKPKNNFFGLFGNTRTNNKNDIENHTGNGQINQEDIGCFINENNKICCRRVTKWCDYYFMKDIRHCYDHICCCGCCELKDHIDIIPPIKKEVVRDLSLSLTNSLSELNDNV